MNPQKEGKITILKQGNNQSCLAACLLSVLNQKFSIKITREEENKLLYNGLKFSMVDFSLGHIIYLCKKFKNEIELHVDSPYYANYLQSLQLPDKISVIESRIDLKLLKKLVNYLPIIYVDRFYFANSLVEKSHFPHFVILSRLSTQNANLMDPFDGKEKLVDAKILTKSIRSLYNKLWIAPKIILIK